MSHRNVTFNVSGTSLIWIKFRRIGWWDWISPRVKINIKLCSRNRVCFRLVCRKLMLTRQWDDESGTEGYDANHYDRLTGEITVFTLFFGFLRIGFDVCGSKNSRLSWIAWQANGSTNPLHTGFEMPIQYRTYTEKTIEESVSCLPFRWKVVLLPAENLEVRVNEIQYDVFVHFFFALSISLKVKTILPWSTADDDDNTHDIHEYFQLKAAFKWNYGCWSKWNRIVSIVTLFSVFFFLILFAVV